MVNGTFVQAKALTATEMFSSNSVDAPRDTIRLPPATIPAPILRAVQNPISFAFSRRDLKES